MYFPKFEQFKEKAKEGNLVPVYREVMADLETPVSAFLKIDDGQYSYLLESVEGGENWGRYTFLGSSPFLVVRGSEAELEVLKDGVRQQLEIGQDPLDVLKKVMAKYQPVEVEGLPRFFGGAVGYLSYDMVRSFESLPDLKRSSLNFPDLYFMISKTLLIFDNVAQKIKLVANAHILHDQVEAAYEKAVAGIEELYEKLNRTLQKPRPLKRKKENQSPPLSNMSQDHFIEMVKKAKEYIAAGDILQVVLSQRFEKKVSTSGLGIYRALRVINPSPYLYYLRLGEIELIGSSPEVLVRCEEGKVEVRPIAGTRRRGKNNFEDQEMARELLADTKERAEHIMLVDLGRNDVGRVSEIGSIKVDELMTIERYSHVMHLVSHVEGRLVQGKDCYDVMRASFPAGTVSGAPKVRAMEIIEELEPTCRGPYAGAVGYVSFSGNLDTCINIRTVVLQGDRAYIQVGAGIVADSDPEREYVETLTKAQAMFKAIEMAEEGLS